MTRLTPEERKVVAALAEAWNLYVALPIQHRSDGDEFAGAIHRAQDIVGMRVARRADPDVWTNEETDG